MSIRPWGNPCFMPYWLRLVLVWSIPAALIVAGVALNVWVIRRNRRRWREHPEQIPRGKRLIARMAPWAAISAAGVVWGVAVRQWAIVFFTAFALVGFAWQVFKASTDPDYPRAPKR